MLKQNFEMTHLLTFSLPLSSFPQFDVKVLYLSHKGIICAQYVCVMVNSIMYVLSAVVLLIKMALPHSVVI